MQFDAARQIGAIIRKVEDRDHEGQPARVVIAERRYDTDIDDLWDAVTTKERIPRWFSPVSGDLRLGGRYQIAGNASGTVAACAPPRRLALTWEFGGGISWVFVTLTSEGPDVTLLELEHIAQLVPEYEAFWNQFGPGSVGVGWDLSLLGLALHIDSGWDKPPEADETFHTKPEGRAFIQGSSTGWEQASVAFGTDAEAARTGATATTAFYTGESAPQG